MISHFYSTNKDEQDDTDLVDNIPEGVAGYVYEDKQAGTVALHRWFGPHKGHGRHFYTTDENGELASRGGYRWEKIQCYVPIVGTPDILAMYRFYNPEQDDHFYTADPSGELALGVHYVPDGPIAPNGEHGPAFYVFGVGVPGTVPLFRTRVVDVDSIDVPPTGPFPGGAGPISQPPFGFPCPRGSHWDKDAKTCMPDH